jgi:hypothetical protein
MTPPSRKTQIPSSLLAAVVVAAAALAAAPLVAGEDAAKGSSTADMPASCPMHAEHMAAMANAAAAAHRKEVDARGDVAMGFRQALTTHHVYSTADGGVIQVTANAASDATTVEQVRGHFREIAAAFEKGDFAIPRQVHGEVPPGVPQLQAEAGKGVRFRYEEIPAGARVVITTTTPEALAAVRSFLGYQIEEHGTGDAPGGHAH